MKKFILVVSTLALIATLNLTAQAAPTGCAAIKAACLSAGFYQGGTNVGKGLRDNCGKPIVQGRSVPGVTVNPADIQACKTEHHMN